MQYVLGGNGLICMKKLFIHTYIGMVDGRYCRKKPSTAKRIQERLGIQTSSSFVKIC